MHMYIQLYIFYNDSGTLRLRDHPESSAPSRLRLEDSACPEAHKTKIPDVSPNLRVYSLRVWVYRAFRIYRVYRAYRVYRVYRVYGVYRV